jgi:hypothetical protein
MKHKTMSFEIFRNNEESNRDTGIKNLFGNYEVSIIHVRKLADNFNTHDEINIRINMLSFRL